MRLLIISALMTATGCATLGVGATRVVSEPPGALVTVDGAGSCETPCRIQLARPSMVTVAKAGYKAQRLRIEPGQSKAKVTLELAAPTDDIESTALPEIK